jgi:myo-inositol-1-phosphate synthase
LSKKAIIAYLLLVSFAISTSLISCGEKEHTEMTADEKILYDSLKIIVFKNMRKNTDSLCSQVHDSIFAVYVDSILSLRRAEVEQLFKE